MAISMDDDVFVVLAVPPGPTLPGTSIDPIVIQQVDKIQYSSLYKDISALIIFLHVLVYQQLGKKDYFRAPLSLENSTKPDQAFNSCCFYFYLPRSMKHCEFGPSVQVDPKVRGRNPTVSSLDFVDFPRLVLKLAENEQKYLRAAFSFVLTLTIVFLQAAFEDL